MKISKTICKIKYHKHKFSISNTLSFWICIKNAIKKILIALKAL